MRKTDDRKAETRQRIMEAAGTLFRLHGIDAVGVDAIMHAAGLTHGGFYGHFASKEALAAEVAVASLARSAARWQHISETYPPAEALHRIVRAYLDPAHVAATAHGCVLTTLGSEVARRPDARPGISASVQVMLSALERCLSDEAPSNAPAILASMVGAVVLARLADDPTLAARFLDGAANGAELPVPAHTDSNPLRSESQAA